MSKLTRGAYEQLIADDLEWLRGERRSLERDHVILIVEDSVRMHYEVEPALRTALDGAVRALDKLRPAVAQYDLREFGHADSGWMCQSCGESSYDRELVVHSNDCESRIIDRAVAEARRALEGK